VVAVDLTGLDTALANLGACDNLCLAQSDITDLPVRKKSFDIVFCHRVLQHTPKPAHTLRHILQYVKHDGAVFIHTYAKTWYQLMTWKYLLRPITSRMSTQRLYKLIAQYAPSAYALTTAISCLPKGHLINHFLIPFYNHHHHPRLKNLSDTMLIEYAIHDTFDALSPRYDRPISAKTIKGIAREMLSVPFEIIEQPSITLLRTVPGRIQNA
jgi:2-polyprenyl-3-methyl-5-hydroxy-6-metoxy-1,4-benzoquinol methylase